jgi:predicted small secreted protein
MKKSITIFGAIVFATFSLTSCGSSVESDAKKLAELQCKSQKLSEKVLSGDMSVSAESMTLATDAAKLAQEIEGKYTTDEEKQKFEDALMQEMGKCE